MRWHMMHWRLGLALLMGATCQAAAAGPTTQDIVAQNLSAVVSIAVLRVLHPAATALAAGAPGAASPPGRAAAQPASRAGAAPRRRVPGSRLILHPRRTLCP